MASGCVKKDRVDPCNYDPCSFVAPASEIAAVQSYLASKNLTAVQHCSGVFYIIDAPGTGAAPSVCSTITANYIGTLTNGTEFERGSLPRTQLGGLIRGWANTLPLIKAGGKIRMFIPPSLGYGNRANGTIPANSILIFEIDLITVQ
jgi:FKBP-type peptidyl-prolyl cis-trans isomerase FkpA